MSGLGIGDVQAFNCGLFASHLLLDNSAVYTSNSVLKCVAFLVFSVSF